MRNKRRGTIFVIVCLIISFIGGSTSAEPNQQLLDGTAMYQWYEELNVTSNAFEAQFRLECTEEIAIETISSKVMCFTKTYEFVVAEAMLKSYSDGVWVSSGSILWRYWCDDGTEIFYGYKHTITVIRNIDRETGLRIRCENPYGVYMIDVVASEKYTYEGVEYEHTFGSRIHFGADWTHSNRYCEEASDLSMGDTWTVLDLGYRLNSYSEFRGRRTIILDVGENVLEFDQETGLLIREVHTSQYVFGTSYEVSGGGPLRYEANLLYQDVFSSETTTEQPLPQTSQELPPETTTETVTIETTTELETSTSEPVIVTVTEREEKGAFIPGFSAVIGLLALLVVGWLRRRK